MEMDNYIVGITSSADTDLLDGAMVEAMKEFTAVRQSGENKYQRYKYETYTDLVTATMPSMLKHGVRLAFYTGFYQGRDVMAAKLKHPASKQWECSTVFLEYPVDKAGTVQRDGQAAETAETYARKRCLRNLTACWVAGPEVAVEQDDEKKQIKEEVAAADEAVAKSKKKKQAPLIDRVRSKLQMVRNSPPAFKQSWFDALKCVSDGHLTEEELEGLATEFQEEVDRAEAE